VRRRSLPLLSAGGEDKRLSGSRATYCALPAPLIGSFPADDPRIAGPRRFGQWSPRHFTLSATARGGRIGWADRPNGVPRRVTSVDRGPGDTVPALLSRSTDPADTARARPRGSAFFDNPSRRLGGLCAGLRKAARYGLAVARRTWATKHHRPFSVPETRSRAAD